MMNPLKGSKNVPGLKIIIFQSSFPNIYGFLESKKRILADFPPTSTNIRLFRAKYYIKRPKNHWRLNTGNCLIRISHFGELDVAFLSNNGP